MAYLDTLPQWMTPGQFMLESEKASESIGRNFLGGMALAQRSKENESLKAGREAQAKVAQFQASEATNWLNDVKEAPNWMKPIQDAQSYEDLNSVQTPEFKSAKGFEAYTKAVNDKRTELHQRNLEERATGVYRAKQEADVAEAEDVIELQSRYGLPREYSPGQADQARGLRNLDRARNIALQSGVPAAKAEELIYNSLPVLPNNNLNETVWKSQIAPHRTSLPADMKLEGVNVDSKGGVTKRFKAPEDRDKWIREKAADIVAKEPGLPSDEAIRRATELFEGKASPAPAAAPGVRRVWQGGKLVPVK